MNHRKLINVVDLIKDIPQERAYRWVSGECHEFAIGLARFLNKNLEVATDDMAVLIGQRFGYDDDGSEINVFSHAVLSVNNGAGEGEGLIIDCYGLDAVDSWEQEFANSEVSKSKHERSEFSWTSFPCSDVAGISGFICGIDGSRAIRESNIDHAESEIEVACQKVVLKSTRKYIP